MIVAAPSSGIEGNVSVIDSSQICTCIDSDEIWIGIFDGRCRLVTLERAFRDRLGELLILRLQSLGLWIEVNLLLLLRLLIIVLRAGSVAEPLVLIHTDGGLVRWLEVIRDAHVILADPWVLLSLGIRLIEILDVDLTLELSFESTV